MGGTVALEIRAFPNASPDRRQSKDEQMTTAEILISAVLVLAASDGSALAGEHHARHRHRIHPPVASQVAARPMPPPGLGQYPAPFALAAQSALPACGFAAVESWGPNGFQYCDPRNERPAYDFQMQGRP
jgi:hypothetical protein